VLSLLYLSPLLTLAAGLDDGKLIMYDLTDLQAFHLAYPPEENSSLTKLAYIEPADDPRACVYIWAFHRGQQYAISVMHSLKFEHKISKEDYYYYQVIFHLVLFNYYVLIFILFIVFTELSGMQCSTDNANVF